MRILNTLLGGAAVALMIAAPAVATARDNVYFNFGYSNGYPTRQYYPPPRSYYYSPPVIVAPPAYTYYAPAPAYYYGERCPPRRHHSLNRHRYRDDWGPRYSYRENWGPRDGYRERAFGDRYGDW